MCRKWVWLPTMLSVARCGVCIAAVFYVVCEAYNICETYDVCEACDVCEVCDVCVDCDALLYWVGGDSDEDGTMDWLQKWLQNSLSLVHGECLVSSHTLTLYTYSLFIRITFSSGSLCTYHSHSHSSHMPHTPHTLTHHEHSPHPHSSHTHHSHSHRWVFRQMYDKGLVYRGFKVSCITFAYYIMTPQFLWFSWGLKKLQ